MRINSINNNYVMIGIEEAKALIYDNRLPKGLLDEISKAAAKVFVTEDCFGNSPHYFGLKREIFEEYDAIDNFIIELENIQNAFMYGVTHSCDENIMKVLWNLVNCRLKIRVENFKYSYPKEVLDYIIKNGGYDYITNKNQNNIDDSEFILYDEDDIIKINLKQRRKVPTLQNPDVK